MSAWQSEIDEVSVGMCASVALDALPELGIVSVATLSKNGMPVPFDSATATHEDGRLRIVCEGEGAFAAIDCDDPSYFRLEGTLADGASFSSERARFSTGTLGSNTARVELDAFGPRLSRSDLDGARFWLCRPRPLWSEVHGNFALRVSLGDEVRVTLRNLVLDGSYKYYFLERVAAPKEHILLVDVGDSLHLDRDVLVKDFRRLSFVLGQQLFLADAWGATSPGRFALWRGLALGKKPSNSRSPKPPVPSFVSVEWMVSLFNKLANAESKRPDLRLWLPLEYYLDTLDEHLDGAYLKLQVALEAFAKRVLGGPVPTAKTLLVNDWDEWDKFVSLRAAEIRAHARDGRSGNTLLKKVRSSGRLPTSSIVSAAFQKLGIRLTEPLSDELNGRNIVTHAALMSDPDEREKGRDRERVAMVRTMLVAMIGASVGYRGRIVGWSQSDMFETSDPPVDFWTVSTGDRSET